jgi:DNA repair protein RadA/Sms
MAKGSNTVYICQQCGSQARKWLGRCPDCGEWNTFVETITQASPRAKSASSLLTANHPAPLSKVDSDKFKRIDVPIREFGRVLGGGLVRGSLVLIGGDPGIGKSTLLLQLSSMLSNQMGKSLYVSAEESPHQVKLRADRLGIPHDNLYILSETNLDSVITEVDQMNPELLIIDSIQTVYVDDVASSAGSVSQVRECTSRLMSIAKTRNIPTFIVGHVTKEGALAGPRVLEHMVDTVLYLEGDRFHQYRLLRAAKNRFGSTDEVGVFEMGEEGLTEVLNPSESFLAERSIGAPGSTVAVTMEGTRPILVEVQALTSTTAFGMPRRTANGIDYNRLLMLVAVLTKRVGLALSNQDIYVNVVGGLKISEPAVDLAVALAIASSFKNLEVDPSLVLIGEVGLSGELRTVSQLSRRLGEAANLGFGRAIHPTTAGQHTKKLTGLASQQAGSLAAAVEMALGSSSE